MSRLPSDYSLLTHFAEVRGDIQLIRALRRLKVATPSAELVPAFSASASQVVLDLRALTASGSAASRALPNPAGGVRQYLTTDGTSFSWTPLHSDTVTWLAALTTAGGSVAVRSIILADRLIRAIAAASFGAKVRYLLPLLGNDLTSALVPLRNNLGVGLPINHDFVAADFSEAHGLQGNGSSKYLDSQIKPSDLGSGGNGGIGWWENNLAYSPATTAGMIGLAIDTTGGDFANYRYFYMSASSSSAEFAWNSNVDGRFVTAGGAATNGHYYGQRSSATSRTLYKSGSLIASSVASDDALGASSGAFFFMGANRLIGGTGYHNSRAACIYMTDGTLTSDEISSLHTLLQTYLIAPLGR